jgi:hypothetical protein
MFSFNVAPRLAGTINSLEDLMRRSAAIVLWFEEQKRIQTAGKSKRRFFPPVIS